MWQGSRSEQRTGNVVKVVAGVASASIFGRHNPELTQLQVNEI